jgi:hypothetical protein
VHNKPLVLAACCRRLGLLLALSRGAHCVYPLRGRAPGWVVLKSLGDGAAAQWQTLGRVRDVGPL